MEYRYLGKSGLQLSALSFGSWVTFARQVDSPLAEKLLSRAYDYGINFFDNAETYENGESERLMGKVLKKLNFKRDTFCLSSKVFWGGNHPLQNGLSRKHITEACHAALKRLQTDHLDLYFCHRPDQDTPIEETVWAMHNLIQQGHILYWGTSEWSSQEIAMAHAVANRYNLIPPTMEQPQYNMFERVKMEHDYVRLFKEVGLGTTIWSPLACGILTGKYNNGIPPNSRATLKRYEARFRDTFFSEEGKQKIKKVVALQAIADRLGMTMAQLAIAWCLRNKDVSTVILGASQVAQLEENIKAIDIYQQLDEEIVAEIETILKNKPSPIKTYK